MSPPESLHTAIESGGPLAELFHEASGSTRSAIAAALRDGAVLRFARALADEARHEVEQGTEKSPLTVLRQCGAGCAACCHTVGVDITPLEAIVIAEHLRRHYDGNRLAGIRQRLTENAARRAAMNPAQRQQVRLRCGLLGDDGLCQAYAARPLICAGVFSLSRTACEAAAIHPEFASQTIPLDRPAKAWTMGVSGGLQRALVDAGLDGNLYELNSIVLCALETPQAAARWLRGEDIFAGCVCTDPHSPPRRPASEKRLDPPQGVPAPAGLAKEARAAATR